jgi:hypothetical protein
VFCYPQVMMDGDQAVVSMSAEPCRRGAQVDGARETWW